MMPTLTERWNALFSDPFEAVRREIASRPRAIANGFGALASWEDEGNYYVEMDVPGVALDDLNITFEKEHLLIEVTRKAPAKARDGWYDERSYGTLRRSLRLTDEVDAESVEATLSDGVVQIKIAKKPEHQPRRIPVRADGQKRLANS